MIRDRLSFSWGKLKIPWGKWRKKLWTNSKFIVEYLGDISKERFFRKN